MAQPRKVLLIGWDAADWKVIHPLMDAGRMPHLRRLVESGCSGPIATLHPAYSPMLWTSIATGKRPYQHGIHGFVEPTPDGRDIQPITNLSRRAKAVWNILNQNDLRGVVIGWWPSHPAEPLDGITVSNHFQRAAGRLSDGWPLLAGAVHPPGLAAALAELRLHPEEVPAEMIEAFVPRAREVDQAKDHRLAALAHTIAECVSIHSAATWLLDNERWDFFAVYYDAIDHFCHGYMRYHPPRQAHIEERDFEIYQHVVSTAYEFHDRMLGTLLQKAGDNVTVVLLSDHGFHPDHLRPRSIPTIPAGPAVEHRDFGILAIAGDGIRRDELIHGASVLDIAPTVLALYGLPTGEDMDGKVLRGVFVDPPPDATIRSWELVPGRDGRHPPETRLEPIAAREALDQLVALGYIERPDENREKAVADVIRELRFNLAESYQDADRHPEAIAILRELRDADPDEQRFAVRLFVSSKALGLLDDMRAIVADLDGRRRAVHVDAMHHIERFRKLLAERQVGHESEKPQSLFSPEERREIAHWENLARFQPAVADYLSAELLTAEGRYGEALGRLQLITGTGESRPALLLQTASLYRTLRQWDEAERLYARALELDPDNPHGHVGLCRMALRRRDYESAARSALAAIQRMYHYPMAHFLLGSTLTALGRYERAAEAYRVALSQNPNFPHAHLRLAGLLKRRLNDPDGAREHLAFYRELRRGIRRANPLRIGKPLEEPAEAGPDSPALPPLADDVVVVSGLPRSGTSMLMQMLAAGGLPILTDGARPADEDNPLGYLEFEAVKRTHDDSSWVAQAKGKAVKVVAPLLPALPAGFRYRVIFIERNLDEILASQREMIARRRGPVQENPERRARLREEYTRVVQSVRSLLRGRPDVAALYVGQKDALADPLAAARRIDVFLGGALDVDRMAAAVKPELHRQRAEPLR